MCRDFLRIKIACHVDEDLIDRVDVDVRRSNVAQIDLVDAHAVVHVECHARRGNMIGDAKLRMCCEFRCVTRLSCECAMRGTVLSPRICLLHRTDDLEEAWASADAVRLERGGDGQGVEEGSEPRD